MLPPKGESGYPTVSPSQLRAYGSGGFVDEEEEPRGCPRKYHAKYVKGLHDDRKSYPLMYGTVFHKALELMEDEGLDPDGALSMAWNPDLGPDAYEEAIEDMRRYLDRPTSPTDRYGTLATETELDGMLYEDVDFGPIYIRGFVDKISVDFDTPNLLWITDYKTNRMPPSIDDVRRDIQAKTYVWLVKQERNWRKLGLASQPDAVFHLDAVKWKEMPPIHFSEANIEAWHAWTVSLVSQILRDDDPQPVINPGCAFCFVRDTCPAYQSLPDLASELMRVKPPEAGSPPSLTPWTPEEYQRRLAEHRSELATYRDQLVEWRDKANSMRLLLQKAVAETDSRFVEDAKLLGQVLAGKYAWNVETKFKTTIDVRRLYDLLGPEFWDAVSTSKTRLEAITKTWSPAKRQAVLDCIRQEPDGTRVVKEKV